MRCFEDEVNSVVSELNDNCEILLNQKVKLVREDDEAYFTCKTEKRLVTTLLNEIFRRYSVERIEIMKWY